MFKLNRLSSKFLNFIKLSTNTNPVVNLSYELNDKFNSTQALVIAHGLFASKASWRSLAKRINEKTKQKIYTVDLRNHGDSYPYVDSMNYIDMASDLDNFIQKVVIEKDNCDHITLMGHSMGGKTVMSLVLKDGHGPKNVDKLIVADIAPSLSPSTLNIKAFLKKMKSVDVNQLPSNIFAARKIVDEKLSELEALKNDYNQRQFLLTRLVERNGKIDWNFNIKSIENHVDEVMGFPEFQNNYHNPTLFIGGELSNYITEKDVPMISKYFTDYRIIKIPKAGHVIHFDNPTDTIKAINDFIN